MNKMKEKKCLVGVDEISLVLQLPDMVDSKDWLNAVDDIILEFLRLSQIETLYGKLVRQERKNPSGYTDALTMDGVNWYFAIAWHEHFQKMGCLVKFSAEAWAVYQKEYQEYFDEPMDISIFLQMIQSTVYHTRLSRIDLTADYKNYGYDYTPNYIYDKLKHEKYVVQDSNGRVTRRKMQAIEKDWGVQTFYIGSRKENSNALLRVYDKRLEQIQKTGFRLEEALQSKDWTRFEASYRGIYAHQITEQLITGVHNPVELSQFIAGMILSKYYFVDAGTGEETKFTHDLMDIAANSAYSALRSENPQNNSLIKSIRYLVNGSGFFPILYKIGGVWGINAESEFLDWLYEIYKTKFKTDIYQTKKCNKWFQDNHKQLSQQPFKTYLKQEYYYSADDTGKVENSEE